MEVINGSREKNFRALNSPWLLEEVYAGKQFIDGEIAKNIDSIKEAA